jgi:GNAT superfamily N-acetyltransferase
VSDVVVDPVHEVTAEVHDALVELLIDAVDGGASVNFLAPMDRDLADRFWLGVAARVADGTLLLFVASEPANDGRRVVGTVSVALVTTPNQQHRFDIAKLLVHSSARGRGIAAQLMAAAEAAASGQGRTLGFLDTEADAPSDRLYRRLGWTAAGTIPGYALNPFGTPADATFFWKRID